MVPVVNTGRTLSRKFSKLPNRLGAIYEGRDNLNTEKLEMAVTTNQSKKKGTLADVLCGADVFIGVSARNHPIDTSGTTGRIATNLLV